MAQGEEKEFSKSEGTAERYRGVIEGFINHLGGRADKPLTAIAPGDIQAFIAKRTKQGVSTATISLDGKVLRTCLNRARKQGIITRSEKRRVGKECRSRWSPAH